MPDHLHVLVEGLAVDSDLVKFAHALKQRTAFAARRHRREQLWQRGYFEHVVRDDELTQTVAKYVLENPVRAGLVSEPLAYPFSGSLVFARDQLVDLWRDRVRTP